MSAIAVNNVYRVPCVDVLKVSSGFDDAHIWEFLRKSDGTYAVPYNGKLLSDSIPEKWFKSQICERK
jgi:hypothetical protein